MNPPAMTLEQIREQGLAVLRKHLGIVGMVRFLGHPFSPGHFVSSITYRDGLTALPWQG